MLIWIKKRVRYNVVLLAPNSLPLLTSYREVKYETQRQIFWYKIGVKFIIIQQTQDLSKPEILKSKLIEPTWIYFIRQ